MNMDEKERYGEKIPTGNAEEEKMEKEKRKM